ncbi:glycosyltransferase family 2 protein [Phocaeicola sp.]
MDEKEFPLISIVTVSYNVVSTIEKTILSVINQTCLNIEYIIIDGGSTDGTVDIIKKYSDKISYWVSEPDKGIYDAMNKGIAKATGKWINFMNCGDYFCNNNVIQDMLLFLQGKVDVLYGNTIIDSSVGKYMVVPESINMLSMHMPFCHQSTFTRTSLMKESLFNLGLKYVADYGFFYSLYQQDRTFEYVNIPIACYQTGEGMTASNMFKCFIETYKVNHQEISQYDIWLYKVKNFLLHHLPEAIVKRIRLRLYSHNNRFTRIS